MLARGYEAFPVASITLLRQLIWRMAVDNDHALSEHPLQGITQADNLNVLARKRISQTNRNRWGGLLDVQHGRFVTQNLA